MADRPGWLAWLLPMVVSAGCAEEFGPERFETTRVEGTVKVAGRPVTKGWVEVFPVEGTRGDLRSAPIRPDGSFEASGVPVGRVGVGLAGVYGPPIPTGRGEVGLGAFRMTSTPIRRDLPPGPSSRLDLDLATEAGLSQRRRLEPSRQGE